MAKTGRKPAFLNVREHLEHVQLILEGFQKYGDVPLIREEVAKCSLINRAIMRKHDGKKASGNRKDIAL